jgi:hypothetical protein
MDHRTANQMQMLAFASAPVIAFICECGDLGCHQTVPLAPDTYHELRSHGEALLHPGHTLVEDAPLAAERQWVSFEEAHVRSVTETLKIV